MSMKKAWDGDFFRVGDGKAGGLWRREGVRGTRRSGMQQLCGQEKGSVVDITGRRHKKEPRRNNL